MSWKRKFVRGWGRLGMRFEGYESNCPEFPDSSTIKKYLTVQMYGNSVIRNFRTTAINGNCPEFPNSSNWRKFSYSGFPNNCNDGELVIEATCKDFLQVQMVIEGKE